MTDEIEFPPTLAVLVEPCAIFGFIQVPGSGDGIAPITTDAFLARRDFGEPNGSGPPDAADNCHTHV